LSFKRIKIILFYVFTVSFIGGCLLIEPEWEDLESDYDHVLNVMGIINLDPGYPSYVGIYRTTNLDEPSMSLVRKDTLGWCDCDDERCWECEENPQLDGYWLIDNVYEPTALIKNASVVITDDLGNDYQFTFVEKITFVDTIYLDTSFTFYGTTIEWDTTYYDTNHIPVNFFIDTTGLFEPQPETNYSLSITAPGFNPVFGSLETPPYPSLDSLVQQGSLVDTVIVNEPFDLHWRLEESGRGYVTGEVMKYFWGTWEDDWCGGDFDPFVIDLTNSDQNPITVQTEYCFEEPSNDNQSKDYFIRLTAMDDNYHDYFIIGESSEYSNALLNYPATKGLSKGIEGGFGFFGSIASDGLLVKIAY
tara:strand:- start:490 stop:1572 length:1083 start_codon:yes stop_codon:yes gene_type:complete